MKDDIKISKVLTLEMNGYETSIAVEEGMEDMLPKMLPMKLMELERMSEMGFPKSKTVEVPSVSEFNRLRKNHDRLVKRVERLETQLDAIKSHPLFDDEGREDLTNFIKMITRDETPFKSSIGKAKAAAILHEWQTDEDK